MKGLESFKLLSIWAFFSFYKIKYKSIEEGSKAEEEIVPSPAGNDSLNCTFTFSVGYEKFFDLILYFENIQNLMEDIQYKVNIYSIVQETEDAIVESKELHEKVIVIDGNLCTYTEDMDRDGLHDNA